MYFKTERRLLERYKIPQAKVSYKTNGSFIYVALVDISKGSIRFEMNKTIENGTFIEIEIAIPTKQKVNVKGHVIWTKQKEPNRPGFAVVQFLPVGTDERFNSTENINQINDLINEFQDGLKN